MLTISGRDRVTIIVRVRVRVRVRGRVIFRSFLMVTVIVRRGVRVGILDYIYYYIRCPI